MSISIGKTLAGFETGKVHAHRNMTLVPIMFAAKNGGPEYLTMKEALGAGVLAVTEVSEGGSVPNLKAVNKGETPVLLLDGEEVAGAKQNRILNTTILIMGKSEVTIPVSCTEHGRWSYESRAFYDSGIMMQSNLRTLHRESVNRSMAAGAGPRGNQGEVWDNIAMIAERVDVRSSTGAMRDIYEQRKDELEDYLRAFVCLPAQKGLLVFIGGRPVGFDYLSSDRAFKQIFPKLLKSYAMEAWIAARESERGGERGSDRGAGMNVPGEKLEEKADKADGGEVASGKSRKKGEAADGKAEKAGGDGNAAIDAQVRAFFEEAANCDEKIYDAVGMGKDCRYNGFKVVGSALTVDSAVIHMAFFRMTANDKAGNMAGSTRRRQFRL